LLETWSGERVLKDSFDRKVENENSGNKRSFSVQLPAKVADWVGKAAVRKEKTPEQFLRELIITSVEAEAMPLTLRLQRLDELVKKIQVTVKKTVLSNERGIGFSHLSVLNVKQPSNVNQSSVDEA
jgi:hypothetical protein